MLGFPCRAAFGDGRLFVTVLGEVYVLDFRGGGRPFVGSGVPVGLVTDMRVEGPHLYANTAWSDGLILAQEADGQWALVGPHDVPRWVSGVALTDRHAVWWGPGRLEVATRQQERR